MSKVFIGVGHGGNDSGAIGNGFYEKNLNLDIAISCNNVLINHGVSTLLSRYVDENDTLYEEIAECNNFSPNYAIDIHNNAGGGDGFEAYYHYKGGESLTIARNIETEVLNIGQNSRGCKTRIGDGGRDYYGFIRETNCPAIIVECAFVDSDDINIIDTAIEREKMGVAIAKGILKTLGIAYKAPIPPSVASNGTRRVIVDGVQIGAYKEQINIIKEVGNAIDNGAKKIEINLI